MSEKLLEVMKRSLRHSDFFAKYSPSQYVILLQGGSQRGCELVYKRISERFSEEKKGWAKNLKYSALPAIQTEKELEFLEGDDVFRFADGCLEDSACALKRAASTRKRIIPR